VTATATNHYATLGVADGADPEAVRRAYLVLARRLHPDRWIDASPDERVETERRMREVNEAWRVLGNPARRLAYDVERRDADRRARVAPPTGVGERYAFATGDLFVQDVDDSGLLTRLVRALPWVLLVGALLGIFIFSAYATAGRGERPSGEGGGRCVRTAASEAVEVPCDAAGARQVIIEVVQVGQCPVGSEPFQPADRELALCLEV
jgi:curved DNA-binding protein CbpA